MITTGMPRGGEWRARATNFLRGMASARSSRATPTRTGVNQADKPSRIYAALRGSTVTTTAPLNAANVEFRVRFADRVQKFFFNNGPLTATEALNRWNTIEAVVDRAVVGESARWGDKLKEPPYTRNGEFLTEVNRKRTSQFPNRTSSALTQLRNAKLYPPTLVAPSFGQFGGKVAPGFGLTMSSTSAGTIYYTMNGVDPRLAWSSTTGGDGSAVDWSGSVAPGAVAYLGTAVAMNASATVKARLRDANGLWSALTEATFQVGEAGIPLRFTEVMFNPNGGDAYEFLEIQNVGATPVDLSLMTLDGAVFTFLRGTTLAAGARLVLASDLSPSLWSARYPGVYAARIFQREAREHWRGDCAERCERECHHVLQLRHRRPVAGAGQRRWAFARARRFQRQRQQPRELAREHRGERHPRRGQSNARSANRAFQRSARAQRRRGEQRRRRCGLRGTLQLRRERRGPRRLDRSRAIPGRGIVRSSREHNAGRRRLPRGLGGCGSGRISGAGCARGRRRAGDAERFRGRDRRFDFFRRAGLE